MDVPKLIDPEISAALAGLPQMDGFQFDQLPAMREVRLAQLALMQLSDKTERRDYVVPGKDGAPDVAIRVHRPAGSSGELPCLYFMHGGGYVFGTHLMDDLRFDRWCPSLNCVGVSVEYRLAPETPYPGPLEDCYTGLKWVYENAATLGVDKYRIGIGGASAGGGLAAGLALLTRDRGEIPVAFQLLIYPMIDDTITSRSSAWQVPVWTPKSNNDGWDAYLGDLRHGDVPPYAAATRAQDLAGLPPAYVMVGALDGFLDEDVEYAMRLTHADVPTELHVYPGAPHGFDGIVPGSRLARQARRDMEDWLARVMARRD
ncbi:MAG: alpha/beta hydrolase [Dehalococcoidia bacterium]